MFPQDENCPPPSSTLFCTEVTVDGREECREYGNLWDHFVEIAAAVIDTAKYTYGTGMRRISLEQYAAAYKLHTGRALESEAVEHGFKSTADLLREVPELHLSNTNGILCVERLARKPE